MLRKIWHTIEWIIGTMLVILFIIFDITMARIRANRGKRNGK